MLIAIAPIVPILAAVGASGVISAVWWYTSRDDEGELGPPGEVKPGDQPAPEPNGPTPDPSAVVEGLVGEYDDAAFHNTLSGDSIARVSQRVLRGIDEGAQNSSTLIQGMRKLLNMSEWNRRYYGEPMPEDPYDHEGQAVNKAFSAKHEDAVGIMRTGFFPKRNISATGVRTGQPAKWGDLWIPALNHDAVRQRVGDPAILLAPPWADGRPATEPPPELFEVLREREE